MSLEPASAIIHSGPRERAIEEGVASLGDAELLAVLLGTGLAGRPVSLVAAGLLDRFAGLEGLARLGASALADHPGLGKVKAARIAAAIEIGRRTARRTARTREPLRSSAAVVGHIGPTLRALEHEEMWLLSLDGRSNLRSARRVAQGGLHGCSVTPRDILRTALSDAASAIVIAHNHPSGDPTPSMEDVQMTRVLVDACNVTGVPLIDHVIVAPDGRYSSMLDLGIIEPL